MSDDRPLPHVERRDEHRPDRRHLLKRPGGRREGDPPEDIDALLARVAIEPTVAERLVDVAVVARRLKVSGNTVRNWILAEKMRAIRTPTGRYRVPLSELARILRSAPA